MTTDVNQENLKNWHQRHQENLSIGQKVADFVANGMGSWLFIIVQSIFVLLWISLNLIGWFHHWDVYPFILLNLLFSTQAAYAAPIIMMSQNRQNERDRIHAAEDFQTNVKAKKEIEDLQKSIARIENEKLAEIIKRLDDLGKK
ncbi:MAG: DUF1003 domain-containing protein [Patescibacteria group bacterium]